MKTVYIVLATLAAWQLLNFIVLAIVERFGKWAETLETVMVWLNSGVVLGPFFLLFRLPVILYKKYSKK